MSEAAAIAKAINLAFSVIASFRRFIGTNDEIKARFDAVDAGGAAITTDEVQAELDSWQSAIDDGRQIP
jgi:hypothetical protein